MTTNSETEQQVVSSQQVLQTIKEMRNRLEAVNKEKTEPIAIIGLGCRFPGNANDPSSFWRLLHEGIDGVTEVPPGRWHVDAFYDPNPDTPGKAYTKQGGFIQQVDQFDPLFFGISPREAVSLDPQQRLLLEVTWEALENAGQRPTKLRNSQTGVYVGICTDDYGERYKNIDKPILLSEVHAATGNARGMAVGRISHFLGLQGPNIQLDTACSSSLVTVHLACQSLRSKECNLALAGGVNLILWPLSTIGRCQLKALAPDGRCKTFDVSADGYGQGEGCGMVVLKRLSDAIADGDTILAVIRGSAVNHDGPSSGLTVPNKMAQKEVIQQALQNARVEPNQVSYVEAHGTGTSLGDPIELESLAAVYGKNRPINQPLVVGSVKTNFGHLEAAAGISGLIKVVLSLQNQEIPPHLHLNKPNPLIPWHQLPLVVPTSAIPWNVGNQPRIAGISAFGISGTNVHIILEEAPEQVQPEESLERKLHILSLSAKTPKALKELVSSYADHLGNYPELELEDICYTANTGRSHFNHRLAVITSDKAELATKLSNITAGKEVAGLFSGQISTSTSSPKIAFLFTGQGSQYINMGLQLYQTQPTFRKTLEECDQILRPYLEKPLLSVLYPQSTAAGENASLLDQTAYTQSALFAIEYALAQLWQSWGIKPDVVMGHSVGEYVAATVAGVFSLEEGLKLIATRGRLMQQLPSGGEMVSVLASESQVREIIASYADKVALAKPAVGIAAINGPDSIVISGVGEAIQTICHNLAEMGITTKPLQVSHAFHSPLMEPMLAEFEAAAKEITYNQPRIPVISNVTGQQATPEIATPEYWVNHVLQPVHFAQSMQTLHREGYKLFLEIGPKPILLGMGRQCLPEEVGTWLPSLRPPQEDWQQILSSLGQLYTQGVGVDWSGFDRDYPRCKVTLPTYPFQRQRYWQEVEENKDKTVSTPIVQLLNQGATEGLAKELELAGELTAQERQLLPKLLGLLVKRQQNYLEFKGGIVHEYYNAVAILGQEQAGNQTDAKSESAFLTFGLFPEKVPDFSWIKCLTEPNQEKSYQMIVESQKELRKLLFAQVNFSACEKVLDFGCGYASDLIQLAQKYEHLQLNGYTISSEQAKLGSTKADEKQLQERVKIFNRDSAKDEFPDNYDLVFGFEVAHHILDKKALFANIGNHLNQQGYLVLADFISNSDFTIDHQETSSYFITKSEWVELLSEHHLQLVAAIDVSPEISNFLYDEDFEQRLEQLYQRNRDENVKAGFKSYYQLGKVLSKGIASYVLLTAQKQQQLSKEKIAEWNQQMLAQLSSYSEVTPERWLYELEWQPQKPSTPKEQTTGNWLLFTESGAVAEGLVKKLGKGCILVSPGLSYQQIDEKHYQLNPTAPEEFKRLLDEITSQNSQLQGIVHLWNVPTTNSQLETAIEYGCASLLHLVQALVQTRQQQVAPLWVVTQGAMSVGTDGETVQVQQTPVWGLGRVVGVEHPELQCRLLDLEPNTKEEELVQLLHQELISKDDENQIAYRQGERRVARLVRRQTTTEQQQEITIVPEGSYLITGGLGALGLQLAKWLADKGAKHLVLTGRRKPSETAQQTITQIEKAGVQVSVLLGDIAVKKDAASIVEQVKASLPPLQGVIHAAGVLDDGVLQQMSWERFTKVMAPKVQGGWHLHQLTQELPLDFFVCFSSAASLLGAAGQGNYAAANAFLDGLAHHRRSLGLPGLSVNWGAWGEGGMAARMGEQFQSRIRSLGMSSIPPEQGLQILDQLLGQSATSVGVFPVNWSQVVTQLPPGIKMPVLEALINSQSVVKETQTSEFLVQLKAAKASDRTQLMTNYLQGVVGKLLGFPDSQMLDPQLGFFDMGMDSLLALELRNLLQTSLGCSVSSTILFEYSNIESLAEYLTTDVLAQKLEGTVEISHNGKQQPPAVVSGEKQATSQEPETDAIAEKFQQIQNLLNN